MLSTHKRFDRNPFGRDFVIGDLHGCYQLLMDRLEAVSFLADRDRLFSVGDLVDRGPDSETCLALLEEDWFHGVLGNHEMMLIDAVAGELDLTLWEVNGGGWAMESAPDGRRRALRDDLAPLAWKVAQHMPLAITVDSAIGPVGLCHAVPPVDWTAVDEVKGPREIERMIWGRRLPDRPVENVARVYVGHTVHHRVTRHHNIVSIDTGAVLTGELTLMEIDAGLAVAPATDQSAVNW